MVSKTRETLMWIKSQMLVTPQYPTTAFTGQTVIVTGSNTGLGFEAARHFVRLGAARVILAVRSIEKGNAAREDIERSQPGPIKEGAVVEVWELDLSRYASVVAFGERCVRELDRLDVVVENAAKLTHTFSRAEGAGNRESTIAVNVVSTMLLALFLLPKLRETAVRFGKECVLTFTGSFTHFMTGFAERHATGPGKTPIFDGLDVEEKANMKERYFVSKLMQLLLTRELASIVSSSRISGSDKVTISTTNPGFVATEIMRESPRMGTHKDRFFKWAARARSPEVGSRTLVLAASRGRETHGAYLDDGTVSEASDWVLSTDGAATQERLWHEFAAIAEEITPGITANI